MAKLNKVEGPSAPAHLPPGDKVFLGTGVRLRNRENHENRFSVFTEPVREREREREQRDKETGGQREREKERHCNFQGWDWDESAAPGSLPQEHFIQTSLVQRALTGKSI